MGTDLNDLIVRLEANYKRRFPAWQIQGEAAAALKRLQGESYFDLIENAINEAPEHPVPAPERHPLTGLTADGYGPYAPAPADEPSKASIVTLCAAYVTARDAQLEWRAEHGSDDPRLVVATSDAYDALVKAITPSAGRRRNDD